jgi:hypothetical protein
MNTKITAAKSPLLAILNELPGGWHTAFAILEHIAKRDADSEEAKLMAAWEEVFSTHPNEATPEMIAVAAGMTPSHMVGLVAEAAHLTKVNIARLIKAIRLDEVAERGVKEALKSSGFKDREAILASAGIYPARAGSINIYNNPTAAAQAGVELNKALGESDAMDEFERDTLDSTAFLRSVDGQPEPQRLESPASFVDATATVVPEAETAS